jgi:hypothetical protein
MLYDTNITIETSGTHKIIDMIPDKKITILSYSLNSQVGQKVDFKTVTQNLSGELKFESNNISDSKTSGITEITGLFHGELNEDILLDVANDEKVEGSIFYADEFNYSSPE